MDNSESARNNRKIANSFKTGAGDSQNFKKGPENRTGELVSTVVGSNNGDLSMAEFSLRYNFKYNIKFFLSFQPNTKAKQNLSGVSKISFQSNRGTV